MLSFASAIFTDSPAKLVKIIIIFLQDQKNYNYKHPSDPLSTHAKFGDASIRTLGQVHGHTYTPMP